MSKISSIVWRIISQFKYVIVTVLGLLWVGVVDDNSLRQCLKYDLQIEELKEEISKYTQRYEADSKRLKDLNRDPSAIAKIARERYFMKADDEDIFVLSDDERNTNSLKSDEKAE
jgi:cell division protein FtsB